MCCHRTIPNRQKTNDTKQDQSFELPKIIPLPIIIFRKDEKLEKTEIKLSFSRLGTEIVYSLSKIILY